MKRQRLSEGTKHDGLKAMLHLIPVKLIEGVGAILTHGARKYEERNWELGLVYSRPFGAIMRHMWSWWAGEDNDSQTGKSHLWHAATELSFLIHFEANPKQYEKFDDRVVLEKFPEFELEEK